ncbi:MAG: hypothetical protein AB8B50_00725 [Pirellulaceae bacterium]
MIKLICCLLLAVNWQVSEYDSLLSLPGTSYWELSNELVRSKELRDKLVVTKAQLSKIEELCGENPLKQEYLIARRKLEKAAFSRRISIQELDQRAWLELNALVLPRLQKILSDQQIESLLPAQLSIRFPSVYDFFSSTQVQRYLELSDVGLSDLKGQLKGILKNAESQQIKLREPGARVIFNALPSPEAKQRFARYTARGFGPNSEVYSGVDLDVAPFPELFQGVGIVCSFLAVSEVREAIDMSPNQEVEVTKIQEAFYAEFSAASRSVSGVFGRESQRQDHSRLISDAHSRAQRELTDVFYPEQWKRLMQEMAYREFLGNYGAPFSRRAFVTYLGVSDGEVAELVRLAKAERQDVQRKFAELEKREFSKIFAELPPSAQDRLHKLFPNGWSSI